MPDQVELLAEIASLKEDLTDQQRQVELLRQSEEKYLSLFRDSAIGMVVVMADGRITQANKTFCDFLGYSDVELLGKTILSITHPDDREASSQAIRRTFTSGSRIQCFCKRYLHKSGNILWGEVTNTLICDAENNPSYAIAQILDITERKRTEEALEKAHDELKRRIAETKLNEARLEAVLRLSHMTEASLQEITDFALEQAVPLTKSKIGYLAFMNEDETVLTMHSWSKEAMAKCAISDKPLLYPLETTGLWGEAARQRKPIVTNDYAAPNPLKKGLPEGHVGLGRHMNVPILDGEHIVIVAGVGNKDEDYDGSDVRQLTLLMEGMWTLIRRQQVRAELQRHRDHLEQLVQERTEALRQSHDELRSIYEGMYDGFMIADVESMRLLKVNTSICRMLGYSQSELLAMSVKDIHPAEEVANTLHKIEARFEGQEAGHVNTSFLRKNGTIFFADLVSSPITFGGRLCLAAFLHDVTEKNRAEMALRASEERFRAVVEDQTEVICRFNADGVFTFVNDVFCRFFGKTSQELLGNKWQPNALPEDMPMIERQLSTMSPENPIVVIENRVYSGLGQVHWMQFVNRGFYDGEGTLTEIQAVGRDITERKQAEEALRKEHRTLKHLLQSSDHERQTIAYEIHDELAQYLTGAIMQFDVYRHLLETKPTDAAKAYEGAMTLLKQSHFEARRLIAGVRPPILDEAGVVEAVSHLINELNRNERPQIEFNSKVQFSRLVPILENAIYRICQEGLSNACKYSDSERVRITLVQKADWVRINIRDWGTGFDTTNVKEGSYGLIGIRERARLLGGKYCLQSAAGKGTRITVELPLMESEE